jgi:hypothetical protein
MCLASILMVVGAMAVLKLRLRLGGFTRIFWPLESPTKQHVLFGLIDFLRDL